MARKRLIKGANAVRVEERISRVPEDLGGENNIFRALKALEDAPIRSPSPPAAPPPRAPLAPRAGAGGKEAAKLARPGTSRQATGGKGPARPGAKAAAEEPQASRVEAKARSEEQAEEALVRQAETPGPGRKAEQGAQAAPTHADHRHHEAQAPGPSRKHIGPEDFTAAERSEIVRCCADYRNHLPIYLLAVQREVEVIDAVIAKCLVVEEARGKNKA